MVCMEYALSVAPSSKLIMALPSYGYLYGVTNSKQKVQFLSWTDINVTLSAPNVVDIVVSMNGALESPSTLFGLSYPSNVTIKQVIWSENFDSIFAKTVYAKSQDFQGVLVYALGIDSYQTWDAIMN